MLGEFIYLYFKVLYFAYIFFIEKVDKAQATSSEI